MGEKIMKSSSDNDGQSAIDKFTGHFTEQKVVWTNLFLLAYLHLAAIYGVYLLLTGQIMLKTFIWTFVLFYYSGFGVTGGMHRLWAHRSYKANLPMRLFLAIGTTLTYQNSIYVWARDHRVHHKWSETDADPHNAKRGFFFSHVGWLMVKKHKDVIEKGKSIDLSDLKEDKIVMFQHKYYIPLVVFGTFFFPGFVPWYFWGETATTAWHVSIMAKYIISVNLVWCINSLAHLYGTKPYDKNIGPAENRLLFILGLGEGFHNFHHSFPWDYKTAECGHGVRNLTAGMINFFAMIGWATELKTATPDIIKKTAAKHGDGTWEDTFTHTGKQEIR